MSQKTVHISPRQFMILIALFVVGSAVLFIPTILAGVAKQDAWISCIIGILCGVLLAWFYGSFSKVKPEMSYIELAEFAFGKWGGIGIALLTFTFHIMLASILLWDIGDFLVTQILVGTPIEVIYYMFIYVSIVYATSLGIEPIARSAEIFFPWVIILFGVIAVFTLPEVDKNNILPVFEQGPMPILYGAYYMIGFPFVEMVLLLMITPYISDQKKVVPSFIFGVLLGSVILFVLTLLSILVLGSDFSSRNEFPIYVLGKKISIGEFLERIEVVVAIIWFISIFFKLSLVGHSFIIGMSQILKMKDYRPLTFPFAIFLIALTILSYPSSVYIKEFSKYASTPYMIFVGFIIPAFVLIIAIIKKNKLNNKEKLDGAPSKNIGS
ncbi:endospore germination permease [Cytobacillus sp. FJAT-54145]|uniref:Endospore germination permease n=1 Tax=Cytobacillus spartinae TaxID=3299023 RepID=A0ABW6KFC2_9BACI